MNATQTTDDHQALAAQLVSQMDANDGLAPLDIDRFWQDQAIADADPFAADCPCVPIGGLWPMDAVFGELEIEEDFWRLETDLAWRAEVCKAYNDKAERIIGRRLLPESPPPDPQDTYPQPKKLHDVFEAENTWHAGSWWLGQSANSEDELKALLDRVDAKDLRSFILPDGWDEAKERLMPRGIKPPRYRAQRGPVTFATSIFGPEQLLFLIMDSEPLAARLRDTILRVMLEIAQILDDEAGHAPGEEPRGFAFMDDNCALLNLDMYRFFGQPVLKGMFDRYAPDPGDKRYQHSDSAMAHLLPALGEVALTQVNFGPTVSVPEIREHLPGAVIDGRLAPFTLGREDHHGIVTEFLRDFGDARESKGLRFATAGSIVPGSKLTGMRLMMSAIQRYGYYQ